MYSITIYRQHIRTVDAGWVRVVFYVIYQDGRRCVTSPFKATTERGLRRDEWNYGFRNTIERDARYYGVHHADILEGTKPGLHEWNRGYSCRRLDGPYQEPNWRRTGTIPLGGR